MSRPPKPIRRVGLVANVEKASCRPIMQEAIRLLRAHGLQLAGDRPTVQAGGFDLPSHPSSAELASLCDLLLVFGGDGTILRVAREIAGHATPLLGIHLGRLGFLAQVRTDQLARAVDQIVARDFRIESRSLLLAEHVPAPGSRRKAAPTVRALNDFVFSRGEVSRLIELEVFVNDEELTRYRCDGLVVASPTGSTAYSLAAGGAIVSPAARVFTLTPICPLTLTNRSVIVDLDSTIRVHVATRKLQTHLTADGQVALRLGFGDHVVIRRAPDEVRLLALGGTSFFRTLRQKLHWSGSHP